MCCAPCAVRLGDLAPAHPRGLLVNTDAALRESLWRGAHRGPQAAATLRAHWAQAGPWFSQHLQRRDPGEFGWSVESDGTHVLSLSPDPLAFVVAAPDSGGGYALSVRPRASGPPARTSFTNDGLVAAVLTMLADDPAYAFACCEHEHRNPVVAAVGAGAPTPQAIAARVGTELLTQWEVREAAALNLAIVDEFLLMHHLDWGDGHVMSSVLPPARLSAAAKRQPVEGLDGESMSDLLAAVLGVGNDQPRPPATAGVGAAKLVLVVATGTVARLLPRNPLDANWKLIRISETSVGILSNSAPLPPGREFAAVDGGVAEVPVADRAYAVGATVAVKSPAWTVHGVANIVLNTGVYSATGAIAKGEVLFANVTGAAAAQQRLARHVPADTGDFRGRVMRKLQTLIDSWNKSLPKDGSFNLIMAAGGLRITGGPVNKLARPPPVYTP